MLTKLTWLFLAGGSGALARYALSGFVQKHAHENFPLGTLVVNLAGCCLFGFIWSLADDRLIISGETRFLILTGFVGAFTTFSTFAFETSGLLQDSQWTLAAVNLLSHNIFGVLAVLLGIFLGRLF